MDDESIQWRNGKPDYEAVNEKYLKEKTKNHSIDSLEHLVETVVKSWEMESTHKQRAEVRIVIIEGVKAKRYFSPLLGKIELASFSCSAPSQRS